MRFKKKNESIIKKGDQLIEESNNFINNLKKRAQEENKADEAPYEIMTGLGTVEQHPYNISNNEAHKSKNSSKRPKN